MRISTFKPMRSQAKVSQIKREITALAGMPMADLWKVWDSHFPSRPTHPNRKHLESRLVYRLQEVAFGGVPIATKSLLAEFGERLSKIKTGTRRSNALLPGTTLLREFDGEEHKVVVLADGRYEFDGQIYKSLSGIARLITGTSWSGPLFFGVKGVNEKRKS